MLTGILNRSLKARVLTAIMLLFIAGIWLFFFVASQLLSAKLIRQIGEQQRSTTVYVAKQIDREFKERIKTLELVAAEINAQDMDHPARLQQHLDQQIALRRMFNAGFWVVDIGGTAIADFPKNTGRIGINYRDRKYFQDTIRDNKPTISDPIIGRLIATHLIVMSAPIHAQDGSVIGVLSAGIRLNETSFLSLITESHYGQTGGYLLVSPKDRMIILATDTSRFMQALPPPGKNLAIDRAMNGFRGTEILVNGVGVEILASTENIPSTQWYIAASLPTAEAFSPINETRETLLAITIILTTVCAALIWGTLRHQLYPLENAAQTLQEAASEEIPPAPLPEGKPDEVGKFIQAFNALLVTLKNREYALQESEARFKALSQGSFGGIAIHQRGIIIDCNKGLTEMTGFSHQELVGMDGLQLIAPPWRKTVMAKISSGADEPYEAEGLRKTGEIYPLAIRGKNIPYQGKTMRVTEFRDISQQKEAEHQQRIAAIAFESPEGMCITDEHHFIIQTNSAFQLLTGYSAMELKSQNPAALISARHPATFKDALESTLKQTGSWHGEIWYQHKNGHEFPAGVTITAVRDTTGRTTNYVASIEDITHRKIAEDEIKNLAFFDQLTGLPNRRLLSDRLKQALATSRRHHHRGAVLFIDLDNFKTLNDTLGHDYGDLLLQQVSTRLRECVREGDTVARLGGDEFVIILETLSEQPSEAATQAEIVGEKIIATLHAPYEFPGYEHHATASIGIALFQGPHEEGEELLKRADMAMYQAKAAGRNTLRFFDPEMQAIVSSRLAMEAGLRDAIAHNHFAVHYQVQVDHHSEPIGAEALLRWTDPKKGPISPMDFISLAEESGLILPIGQWVLATVCAQLAQWAQNPQFAHLSISINISARQFQQWNFVDQVIDTIRETGANPHRIKLELTESMLVQDIDDIVTKMQTLKDFGISFSLDDFGTGYSSLGYLKQLPLDELKIDQRFVRDILMHPDDAAIAKTIITLGGNLGLRVMAEGVEHPEQQQFLANNGCHSYQGYLFGKPQPIRLFEAALANQRQNLA